MKDTSILLEPRSSSRKLLRTKKFPHRVVEHQKSQSFIDNKEFLDSIEMLPVRADKIAAIGYCDLFYTLQVDYCDGSRYRFYGILPAAFERLLEVDCLEQYLDYFIKLKLVCEYGRLK
jgi:hypothetical protein